MIGTDLNLVLPSTSETMAENIARIATGFEAIEDSIAQKATPAAFDINAAIDMQGNSIVDLASAQFVSGNMGSIAGTLYFYNGDWYAVDEVGIIQLTDNGQINAAGVGGIVGDYGGVNPAKVEYVDSSGQYIFTEDTGVYADLRADDLILEGDAGRVTFNVDAALTGDRNVNIKLLASVGTALLVYDASDESLSTTNTIPTPTAPDYKYTTARTRWLPFHTWFGTSHTHGPDYWTLATSTSAELHIPIPVETGERITGWNVYFTKGNPDSMTAELYGVQSNGARVQIGSTVTTTSNTSGVVSATGLTEDVAYGSYYLMVRRTTASAGAMTIKIANVTLTRP